MAKKKYSFAERKAYNIGLGAGLCSGDNVADGLPLENYTDGAYLFGFYAYNPYIAYSDSSLHVQNAYNYAENYQTFLTYLNYLFYADGNADDYLLRSEDILNYMEAFTSRFGAISQPPYYQKPSECIDDGNITSGATPSGLVLNRYSRVLFDYVANTYTDVTLNADETFSLTSMTVSDNIWDRIFGTTISNQISYEMSAIQKVTSSDIQFYNSSTAFCNKYYVAQADYSEFCNFVNAAEKASETVFLFRYYQSEYVSAEATEFERTTEWALIGGNYGSYKAIDTNAYFCQTYIQLNFEILDMTFTKDNALTIIPVVMTPIDIVPDIEPPIDVTPEGTGCTGDYLSLILTLGLTLLLIVLLAPFLPMIINVIVWIVMLPFRLIGALFKGIKKNKKQKKG